MLHGKPWPKFKYDAWAEDKKPLFDATAVEGTDYVRCLLCAEHGWDFRFSRMVDHLKPHDITEAEYLARFLGAPVRLDKTTERRKATTLARYQVDNISRSEVSHERSRKTSQERYGVEHASQAPEVRERRVATNLERYGTENPFGAPKVQEKIRQTHLATRGVENPNQDPEVQAKRVATNQERYGADHFVETDAFKEKLRATSKERYGTDHPMQSEVVQAHHGASMLASHGVSHPFHSPTIQRKAYDTNLANHGGKHSQQCPDVLAKARATWMEKYGVDNPSKVEEIKAKIKDVWLAKYGVPFPPQSLWMNRKQSFPTGPEKALDALSPECVVYAGDGSYWVRYKGATKARNPDFVVLKREQVKSYQEGVLLNDLRTSAIIEVFGDWWHGPKITGKARELHKMDVERYYAKAGIVCLVIWESEIKAHPKRVAVRIQRFLSEWRRGVYKDLPNPTGDALDLFGEG